MLAAMLVSVIAVGQGQQRENDVEIIVKGPVEFIVKDFAGRMTGFDPRSETYFKEIPGASYGTGGVDTEDPTVPAIVIQEFGFGTGSPSPGKYSVSLIGTGLGVFEGRIVVTRLLSSSTGASFVFKGIINRNQVVGYLFVFAPDSANPLTAEKEVPSSILRQDLDNSYKLKLLGEKELHKDLSHRLDKLEKYLSDKDSSKARHELEKFGEKIEDVRDQTIKTEQKKQKPLKHFITADAYQILQEDVNALLKQLPDEKKGKKEKDDDKGDD